ncbi:LysR family transcriptional regulator [Pseudoruegeria sp. HB172150]|uniref:LysR family transcriptional regulator n=1 Tax=Pseudoruegeria sp. HB172150 TaxID=2721164 RepID=UPI001552F357|nr:LysR family transcriptional regulator [Pseudoruegeria sp. HB172150]
MANFLNIQAFLITARTGSFSAAARAIGVAPSVVTKRVGRFEDEIGAKLFVRSTRKLTLTREAEELRPRLQLLLSQLDDVLKGAHSDRALRGHLRIKAPTTIGTLFAGPAIACFQAAHPDITVDLMLIDGSVNPLEEGFDMALGALPQSYASVTEFPLCPYPRVVVASTEYLKKHGTPQAPGDLVEHRCVAYVAVGLTWHFESPSGPVSVEVNSVMTVNDSRLLLFAARQSLGIAVVPEFMAREEIERGTLQALMPDFPISPLWFKAMVPRNKLHRPEVMALLEHLKADFAEPPWQRGLRPRLEAVGPEG